MGNVHTHTFTIPRYHLEGVGGGWAWPRRGLRRRGIGLDMVIRWVWLTGPLVTGCIGMVLVPSSVVTTLPVGVSITDSPGT